MGEFVNTISAKAKDLQTSLKTRLDEDAWRKGLRAAMAAGGRDGMAPLEPIVQLMGKKHNPIAELTADFVRRERVQLETALASNDHGTLERAVQRCLGEFDVFSSKNLDQLIISQPELIDLHPAHMSDLFKHNYSDEFDDDDEDRSVQIELSIEHFLFTTPLAHLLRCCLQRLHRSSDQQIHQKCMQFGWEETFLTLGLRDTFRLGQKHCDRFPVRTGPYEDAVEEIRRVTIEQTPLQKVNCICKNDMNPSMNQPTHQSTNQSICF